MKLFRHFSLLMSVITLIAVTSCKEAKVTPDLEKSLIETLLEQPEPAQSTDVHYNYARDKRFLILKTGLDPQEMENNPYFSENDGYGFSFLYEKEGDTSVPTDTIGLLQSVEVLRQTLTATGNGRIFFDHYEVLAIEDVLFVKGLYSNLKYQCLTNKLNVILNSPDQIQTFVSYAESLHCRIGEIKVSDTDSTQPSIGIILPLGTKALAAQNKIQSHESVNRCDLVSVIYEVNP